jgi:two-component system LytT family response regulator
MSAPIRTLIVDDVALARERVRRYLEGQDDIEIVGEAASGADALTEIKRLKPQLLFLDVELPDFDGFAIAAEFGEDERPVIIYLTAHESRALEAFEVRALDYLVKPFDRRRFLAALDRAREHLALTGKPRAAHFLTTLTIREGRRTDVVDAGDVDYIDVAGHYLCVHVGRAVHLIRGSLSELETRLDPAHFQRIHRSAMVRLDRIKTLTARRGGDADLTLTSGARLVVSRTYAPELKKRLKPGAS